MRISTRRKRIRSTTRRTRRARRSGRRERPRTTDSERKVYVIML
jgi:hypothetical protein